jgi:UDP-GlcNAc:undecaprenyl-phosphate GlcNAc-1-phosphate transferase
MQNITELIVYIMAFGASVILNLFFVKFWKFDLLKSPWNQNRWKPKQVPLTGGISILFLFVLFLILRSGGFPKDSKIISVFIGGIFIFLLGLFDDILDIKSYHKFLIQIGIVLLLISFGVRISMFGKPLGYILTFFWILGITNAFNLLDNMDGLSAGIGAIAFFFLGINFIGEGAVLFIFISFIFTSLLLGFLVFNFNPAKIYLGDSGSLTIGYFLSVLPVLGSQKSGRSVFITIVFPIMIMLIPIMDTVLVSVTRNLRGQSPFEGGKDHLSHRLVMLGLSEKQAVLFLYLVSVILGISVLLFKEIPTVYSMILYFFISMGFVLFGIYIGKIKIVNKPRKRENIVLLSTNFLYKKKIFHIMVDLILVVLVYYFAYLIRFEAHMSQKNLKIFLDSFPIVIFFKILCFHFSGIYKIESRYFSFSDGLKVLKGVSLGSVLSVVFLTLLTRFVDYSRAVFVIDWMLTLMVVGGVKVFYRFFEELFAPVKYKSKRKIILVGDERMVRSIDKYLGFRTAFNLAILKNIPLTDFDFDDMMEYLKKAKSKIHMIVVGDKNLLTKEEVEEIQSLDILVFDEREFFDEILK